MNTTANTPATVAPKAKVHKDTARGLKAIEKDLIIDGGVVTIRKGAILSASDMALFIADRDNTGSQYKTQARWAFYAAGMLPNGTEVQKTVVEKLRTMMTKSALDQLKSEALTLCPLVVAEGIKTPLSVLKDVKAALAVDKTTGKLLPLEKQSEAAKELIPLLKSGELKQAQGREIREKHNKPSNNPAPAATPAAPSQKPEEVEAVLWARTLGQYKSVVDYLTKNRLAGDEAKQFIALTCDMGRLLGLQVSVPNAPAPKAPAPAAPVTPAPAKVEPKQEAPAVTPAAPTPAK